MRAATKAMVRAFRSGASLQSAAKLVGVSSAVFEYRLWLALFAPRERKARGFAARAKRMRAQLRLKA